MGGLFKRPTRMPQFLLGVYDSGRNAFVFNLSSTVQALMKGQLQGRERFWYQVELAYRFLVSSFVAQKSTILLI